MHCKDFLERHTDWLEGELDPTIASQIMAHAATCQSCARYDRVVRRGAELARELLPPTEVSPEFGARMRHRLFHERDEMARRRTAIPAIYAAAASFILVTAGAGAFAVAASRTPVVDVNVAFAAAPPAMTTVQKHAHVVEAGPTLALADFTDERSTPIRVSEAPAKGDQALEAEIEPWPVYSRGAVAVAFPASRASVVARPADFRSVGSRAAATPLIIRY